MGHREQYSEPVVLHRENRLACTACQEFGRHMAGHDTACLLQRLDDDGSDPERSA